MRWLNFLHFSLQTLLLDENLFDELPVYLSLVPSLRNVTFRDNIIGSPNQDILDLGWPGIKTYFLKQLENEPVKLSAEIRWGLVSHVANMKQFQNIFVKRPNNIEVGRKGAIWICNCWLTILCHPLTYKRMGTMTHGFWMSSLRFIIYYSYDHPLLIVVFDTEVPCCNINISWIWIAFRENYLSLTSPSSILFVRSEDRWLHHPLKRRV